MKVMILPGNGNTPIDANWYPYAKEKLEELGLDVILTEMPDPELARKEYWLPFIEEKTNGEENLILIGHSSGAIAILKYLETHKIRGAVLVGVYHTDLGEEEERQSGYFDDEWKWEAIKKNIDWIVIFASTDDPYFSIDEPRFVRDQLGAEYYEYTDQGHFGSSHKDKTEFREMIEVIKRKLQ